jgi:hypothetical protein
VLFRRHSADLDAANIPPSGTRIVCHVNLSGKFVSSTPSCVTSSAFATPGMILPDRAIAVDELVVSVPLNSSLPLVDVDANFVSIKFVCSFALINVCANNANPDFTAIDYVPYGVTPQTANISSVAKDFAVSVTANVQLSGPRRDVVTVPTPDYLPIVDDATASPSFYFKSIAIDGGGSLRFAARTSMLSFTTVRCKSITFARDAKLVSVHNSRANNNRSNKARKKSLLFRSSVH